MYLDTDGEFRTAHPHAHRRGRRAATRGSRGALGVAERRVLIAAADGSRSVRRSGATGCFVFGDTPVQYLDVVGRRLGLSRGEDLLIVDQPSAASVVTRCCSLLLVVARCCSLLLVAEV